MLVLVNWVMHLITAIFLIGLAGSAIVVVLSFIEDSRELFGSDEPSAQPAKSAAPAHPAL
jgi:hypothetical protein